MSNIEQTLSIIKPDAVERNLENEIKEMFKNTGFNIHKEKKIHITKSEAEQFYKVHETKPFYNDLCAYLSSGPIVVMILEHENAVLRNRDLMGATNPKDAEEGTIRKKYGISIDKNSVHGSDSLKNAKNKAEDLRKNCLEGNELDGFKLKEGAKDDKNCKSLLASLDKAGFEIIQLDTEAKVAVEMQELEGLSDKEALKKYLEEHNMSQYLSRILVIVFVYEVRQVIGSLPFFFKILLIVIFCIFWYQFI